MTITGPHPVISPYTAAKEYAHQDKLEDLKRAYIKDAFIKPKRRGVFLTERTMGALAVHQDTVERDTMNTINGPHSRTPVKSIVLRVNVAMQNVDEVLSPESKAAETIERLLKTTGVMSDTAQFATPFVINPPGDTPIDVIANKIHVKKEVDLDHNKAISFVGKKHKTFGFKYTVGGNTITSPYTLYVAKNDENETAYLRLEHADTDPRRKTIRECVLIFNGYSSLAVKQQFNATVKPIKASWESQPTTATLNLTTLQSTIDAQSEHTMTLIAYLEARFPAIKYTPKDNCDCLRPDEYMQYSRTMLHDISKLHYTFAYLRAFAAVLMRNASGYSGAYPTFEGITNQIQAKIDEALKVISKESSSPMSELIMAVTCAADFVNALMIARVEKINDSAVKEKLNTQIHKLYMEHKGLDVKEATYKNFGNILAVRLFETTNPSKTLSEPEIKWVDDYKTTGISGHEWGVGFKLKLHTNKREDLRDVLDDTVSFLDQYDFFYEDKGPWCTVNRYDMRVKYIAAVSYVFTTRHPYSTLHGTTVH
jgi:hypothetical protein